MANESAHFTPEANQPVDKVRRFGALRSLAGRAINRALGLVYGNEGSVMVQGPAVPVSIDANPKTREHLFGEENPADYQPGPVSGEAGQGTSKIVPSSELGIPTSVPETADNLGVEPGAKPNSTQDLLKQYLADNPVAGDGSVARPELPGSDAVGAPQIDPDQNLPVQNRGGTIRQ